MSLSSHILEEKKDHSCEPCEGPFEHWGKSSGFQMIRCKSCKVVHFFEPGEIQNLEISNPRPAETDPSGQDNSPWKFSDIYAFEDESETLQDLTTYNFEPDEKTHILNQEEKPFLPYGQNKTL